MQKDTLALGPALLFEAILEERVAPGRLMTPVDVKVALSDRSDAPPELSGWVVCGNISPQMFEAAQAIQGRIKHATSFLELASGRSFLIPVQQVGPWQHRFVIPLVGGKVAGFVDALERQPLRMSLSSGHGEESLVASIQLPPDDVNVYKKAIRQVGAATPAQLFGKRPNRDAY